MDGALLLDFDVGTGSSLLARCVGSGSSIVDLLTPRNPAFDPFSFQNGSK